METDISTYGKIRRKFVFAFRTGDEDDLFNGDAFGNFNAHHSAKRKSYNDWLRRSDPCSHPLRISPHRFIFDRLHPCEVNGFYTF
jgi:hypothetical protein